MTWIFEYIFATCSVSPGEEDSKTGEVRVQEVKDLPMNIVLTLKAGS